MDEVYAQGDMRFREQLCAGMISKELLQGIIGGVRAARGGHDVIMSPTSHCYFDYKQSMRSASCCISPIILLPAMALPKCAACKTH